MSTSYCDGQPPVPNISQLLVHSFYLKPHSITMSAEKRPASDDPSGGQLVKRQNIGTSRALTSRSNGSGDSGALVAAVGLGPRREP